MTTQGLMGKGAPPNLPHFLLFIKIAILVLSVVVLALAAWAIAIFNSWTGGYYGYYGSGVSGLLIFVVVKTWIIYGVLMALEFKAPHLFYRIIGCIGYAISIIFWLSAWAWAASNASAWLTLYSGYDGYIDQYTGPWKTEGAALAAAAGVGAIIWVLSIVHFVFFVRACLADNSTVTHNQAELGQVHQKQEATSTVYVQGQQPVQYQQPVVYQQAYPQQQVYQQHPQQAYATQ